VKSSKVNGDHNIIAFVNLNNIAMLNFITDVRVGVLSSVVIVSIDNKLLRGTLWLNDDVLDKDWYITDLKPLPSFTFIP
jgi:hypothetical protein